MASDSVDRDKSDPASLPLRSTSFSSRIALVSEHFLRAWRSGNRLPIEEFLVETSVSERRLMLLALLRQELSLLMQMGKLPLIDPYLTRFPDDPETVAKAFTLAQRDVDSEATVIVRGGRVEEPVGERLGQGGSASNAGPDQVRATGLTGSAAFSHRYRKVRILGRGTYGTVWVAEDLELRRLVAVKEPHADHLRTEADVDKYLAEARVLASLDHPHIVPVYDFGRTAEGSCYVVSKLIDGMDLASYVKCQPLTCERSAALVMQVAEALQHTHRRGLVHRDIKPANILLDENGRAYVTDFGLALHDPDGSHPHHLVGSPNYMSPEQALGEGHLIDGRSDIFSLGVVLYELLTGKKPFRGRNEDEILQAIIGVEVKPPRQRRESIPLELERICLKALSKRVSDRHADAAELAADLQNWLEQPEERGRARRGEPKVVPKGLRSFDAADRDFFVELLPGARDRDGLPEAIRFWKARLEEPAGDKTFRVGVVYGPSGCGKSSLIKAGLLPRLANHLLPVFVEATPDQTEQELLLALRRLSDHVPQHASLAKTLASIRRGKGVAPRAKVVLVIDQFEQWLLAHRAQAKTELATALRQCDGERLQAVLLVRDDFWMPVSEFLHELEVSLLEGVNACAVSLFDPLHARRVLAEFGRAYGRLPEELDQLSPNQESFLNQAVDGLIKDGKVICVKLALFAQMMEGREWSSASLHNLGGLAGVGETFLEDVFSSSNAPPLHRQHQLAARAVLQLLLPDRAREIKGQQRSRDELLAASGYASRPGDFAELLRLLDGHLRLITPVMGTGEADAYQLTHDYLVPALRDWLTRKQQGTRRGRAKLRLDEHTATWHVKPEPRYLPSLLEYLQIAIWTRSRDWTAPQRQMMRRASRKLAATWGISLLLLLVFAVSAGWYRYSLRHEAQLHASRTTINALQSAPAAAVPFVLKDLAKCDQGLVLAELRSRYAAGREVVRAGSWSEEYRRQLRLAYALARLGYPDVDFLFSSLDIVKGEENELIDHLALIPAARWKSLYLAAVEKAEQQGQSSKDWSSKARLAILGLQAGMPAVAVDLNRLVDRGDPLQQTQFIHQVFPTVHGDLRLLAEQAEAWSDAGLLYGICLALGRVAREELGESRAAWKELFSRWYQQHPHSGVHSAAASALLQWGETLPEIPGERSREPPTERNWWSHEFGFTLLRLDAQEAGADAARDRLSEQLQKTLNNGEYWLADREVTVGLFQRFLDDPEELEKPLTPVSIDAQASPTVNHPAQQLSWQDAVLFCNWLSRREGRRPWYRIERAWTQSDPTAAVTSDTNLRVTVDPAGTGYRLPTELEWEYACRAGSVTKYSFGDSVQFMDRYGVQASIATQPASFRCSNRWGAYDMHGNVSELCHDEFWPAKNALVGTVSVAAGESLRISRGGGWESFPSMCQSGGRVQGPADYRDRQVGFRVVLAQGAAQEVALGASASLPSSNP